MAESENQKPNIWKKIWTIIANAILALLILVGILTAISLLPLKNNYKILTVMSGSMEPTIPVGALIVIKPEASYQVGDIITFKSPNSNKKNDFTTHRLVEIQSDGTFVTKGDANKTDDTEHTQKSNVVGKEKFSIALLGYLLGYIKTLPGLILIVIIPAVIIVYEEVNKIKHEAKQMVARRRVKRDEMKSQSEAAPKTTSSKNNNKNKSNSKKEGKNAKSS